jgi:hypothetical protein
VLDEQVRFSPNSASLNGSESGGGLFTRWVLPLVRTRNPKTNRAGKKEKGRTMMPLIHFRKATLPIIVLFSIACFGLASLLWAVIPPPDGGYPGGNTAEGQNALLSLTTGGFNTAVGYLSLRSDTSGSINGRLVTTIFLYKSILLGSSAQLCHRGASSTTLHQWIK